MLVRNTFFSALTLGLRFASSALVFILIARALGAEEFGRFAFAVSFTGIFMVLLDYGFNLYIVKEVAASPGRAAELSGEVIGSKLLLSAAATVILFLVVKALDYPLETELVIYVLWLSSIFYSFGLFLNSIFKGLNRFQYETYPTIVLNAVQVALIVLLLFLGFGVLSIAFAYLAARVLYFGVSHYFVRSHVGPLRASLSFGGSMELLKGTFPFGVHAILAAIYFQIDTVLLSFFRGDAEAGYYQAAMRLVIAAMLVYDVVVSSYYSIIAAKFKADPEGFRRDALAFNKYMLLIGGIISSSMFLFPDLIIDSLYGPEYGNAIAVLQLLSVVVFLRFLGGPYGVFLTIGDNQAKRAIGVLISVLFNVALNLIFIPKYGVMGAALVCVLTHFLLCAMYYSFSLSLTGSNFMDAFCYRNLAVLLLCIIASTGLKGYSDALPVVFFMAVSVCLVLFSVAHMKPGFFARNR